MAFAIEERLFYLWNARGSSGPLTHGSGLPETQDLMIQRSTLPPYENHLFEFAPQRQTRAKYSSILHWGIAMNGGPGQCDAVEVRPQMELGFSLKNLILLHAIDRNHVTRQRRAHMSYVIFSDGCGLSVAMQNCSMFGPRLIPLPHDHFRWQLDVGDTTMR